VAPLWLALAELALLYGRRLSPRDISAHHVEVPIELEPEIACVAMRSCGFGAKACRIPDLRQWSEWPVLIRLRDGGWALLHGKDGEQVVLRVFDDLLGAVSVQRWDIERVSREMDNVALVVEPVFDSGESGAGCESSHRWFWEVFHRLRPYYGDCAVAAILVNILALASSMFSMNVYDRIIPNAALHSLWVLAIGVILAGLLELGLRTMRAYVLDEAGKRADLALSSSIFRQALNLDMCDRPRSSGQFAGQLREFESVRDFVGSATLVAITDLPFVLLFFFVIAFIGGGLVLVPVSAAFLILALGALSQWPIRESVKRYQYENTQKHAFLVEALERLETIEALGAQRSIQGRWERLCATAARSAMGFRLVSALTANGNQFVQQGASTLLIVLGVYAILEGKLTVGALIGCSILSGRAIAPLAQVAGLMVRWQHTRAAFESVHKLMMLAPKHAPLKPAVRMDHARGDLCLSGVRFAYPGSESVVLDVERLSIPFGEITAVMGPIGSGKSTLLRLVAGLIKPAEGRVSIDGLNISQISSADWRAQVAWVGQESVLFRGTLRENILLAAPEVGDDRLLYVLRLCGLDKIIADHPMGLDMPLGEAGLALSGGQRQMVVLARALLADSPILLLDEPTSAFDANAEYELLSRLRKEFETRLVVVATHRPAALDIASRLVILDRGSVVAEGPRDRVLRAIRQGDVMRSSPKAGQLDPSSRVVMEAEASAP
jgi:ATP-binding cassette subfamily C protein LapB